jgi:hypothetical protein
MVKLLAAYTERKVKTLDTALLKAANGASVQEGRVLISPDQDVAPWLADPLERERRLRRMRAVRMDGAYHGDKGKVRFGKDDREAIEQGWDPVATAEFQNAERQARAQAQAEASRLQAPLDQTTALRQERLALEAEVKELDRQVEAKENADAEASRRGHAKTGPPIGRLLERQRAVTKQLEQVSKDRRLELDSIPGYRFIAEQPDDPAVKLLEQESTRESVRQLQARINAAEAHVRRHPEVEFVEALNLAEQGKIMLAQDEPRTIRGPLVPLTPDEGRVE